MPHFIGKPSYLEPNRILIEILCRNYRGGLSVLAQKPPKNMQKPALQDPMQFSIYRGGIDKKSHVRAVFCKAQEITNSLLHAQPNLNFSFETFIYPNDNAMLERHG